jgi:co-chaperonin GroES (HSP10)
MNYVTTADRVVVEPDPDHETTASGFIIAYDDTPTQTWHSDFDRAW